MKTKKLIGSLLSGGSSGRAVAIGALIGGLAVGAVIGVLLAPNSGMAARQKLSDSLNGLLGRQEETNDTLTQSHPQNQNHGKKPKSDIKKLIHHAHEEAAHTEHNMG